MERSKEKVRQRPRGKARYMQTGREKSKVKEGGKVKQLAASSCCDLSALTGMSGANMHLPCPLGQFPWKRYFSPIPIYCMFIQVAVYSQQSACGSNGLCEKKVELKMTLVWTQMQHGGII